MVLIATFGGIPFNSSSMFVPCIEGERGPVGWNVTGLPGRRKYLHKEIHFENHLHAAGIATTSEYKIMKRIGFCI